MPGSRFIRIRVEVYYVCRLSSQHAASGRLGNIVCISRELGIGTKKCFWFFRVCLYVYLHVCTCICVWRTENRISLHRNCLRWFLRQGLLLVWWLTSLALPGCQRSSCLCVSSPGNPKYTPPSSAFHTGSGD